MYLNKWFPLTKAPFEINVFSASAFNSVETLPFPLKGRLVSLFSIVMIALGLVSWTVTLFFINNGTKFSGPLVSFMMYDANLTFFRNIIPLDELKSTDLLLSCMISDPFNVNGLGEILNITFERGSFVSKLIILMVSVPEFCEYFFFS